MTDIDRNALNALFNIETDDIEEIPITTFKEVLKKAKEIEDPNNVLTSVIEKAGTFLDMIERESVNGGMSARYMEVASTLINTIVTAANSIATVNSMYLENELKKVRIDQKDRELDQKDKELEIKEFYYKNKQIEGGAIKNQNNILVTDRESILKFLENKNDVQK